MSPMATFSGRVALFDNAEGVARNENSPALTGKLEINESQIEALMDELMNGETQTYGTRKFKVIDLSLWQTDGSSALKYSGKAKSPFKKSQTSGGSAPVSSADDLF